MSPEMTDFYFIPPPAGGGTLRGSPCGRFSAGCHLFLVRKG
ncbi:hypothetical protein BACCAP_00495 [Pseudoflavonifractor capillosus ATCC 29799]|uniref:Uncharacterized protein n=1 Tax=Pseudoflavonifractor capillosus ATCC 29799 TaxID=411467 RepID=A6NQM4_9FIRM|nr:hypothetical protein BACCAP_00495 [Pseudoflavonifractor capillosus ATCC 29799]